MKHLSAVLLLFVSLLGVQAQEEYPFRDVTLPIEERVNDFNCSASPTGKGAIDEASIARNQAFGHSGL